MNFERKIAKAKHRLWFIRWLNRLTVSVGVGALLFAVVVLVQRLFEFPWPLLAIGLSMGVAALAGSVIWTIVTREDDACAAARLDLAAGLKERISSGRYCAGSDDPFANAVVADAEKLSNSITVSRHIRIEVPRALTMSSLSAILAALMFLITPGLLKSGEATARQENPKEVKEVKLAVKRELDTLREEMEATPGLEDLKDQLASLEMPQANELKRADDLRHDAVKRIDKLADAVKQKVESGKYEKAREVRKLLRRLKVPKSADSSTQQLAKSMMKGDFKSAQEEINKLKEQLSTLKTEEDKAMVEKISKQLDDLSKQLEKLAKDDELEKKLAQAGVKPEDVKRMLENLSKKDLEQLKKQLEKSGMNQKEINKLAQQIQKKMAASNAAKQLAKSMKSASAACQSGQAGDATAALAQAGSQLSELEMLEQEMQQLKSASESLRQSRCNLDGKCQGNKPGDGRGGMGRKPGQGRGGLAPEQQANVDFKTERQKTHIGKGSIIGQMEYEGEQVEGELRSRPGNVLNAASREASDLIARDRIPRQYHKAIKRYFSMLPEQLEEAKSKEKGEAPNKQGD